MTFLFTYAKEIVSASVTIGLWVLNRILQPKVKLQYGFPHGFTFIINQQYTDPATGNVSPSTLAHTRSFIVRNDGSQTAENVELIFNYRPQHLNLWPTRTYSESTDQHDRYIMKFSSLAPKEHIRLEALAVQPFEIPGLLSVRSDQVVGREIAVMTYKFVPAWQVRTFRMLAILGAAAFVYWLITIAQFLVLKTPGGVVLGQ